jgi:hypothetical protein
LLAASRAVASDDRPRIERDFETAIMQAIVD